jgi:hypothetical protein
VAGCLGSLLGISGGIFLVPFLILALELPVRTAVAISLMTVIATSSVASANEASQRLLNLRLGMLLQLTSTVGVLTGGLTAMVISEQAVLRLFAIISVVSAIIIFSRLGRRNVTLDPDADPGRLGGRFFEQESGGVVTYRVRRVWLGLGVSFIAGNLASVLGIGGGIITVPVLNVWCGVPMRVAAATSAFLIGITAVAAIPAYYVSGDIVAYLSAAAVLGVLFGARVGFWVGSWSRAKWLKLLLGVTLLAVSAFLFARL